MDPNPTPDAAAPEAPGEAGGRGIDALHRELARWRERVPKLVAALRARNDELERLRAELAGLKAAGTARGGRVLSAVPVTGAAASVALERDSLIVRNARLLETTELASRQMAKLADDLAEMRARLNAMTDRFAAAQRERETAASLAQSLRAELEGREHRLETLERDMAVLHGPAVAAASPGAGAALADGEGRAAFAVLEAERDRLAGRAAAVEARFAEREQVLADARELVRATFAEQARLATRLEEQQGQREALERALRERSELVVALEQELQTERQGFQALEGRLVELEVELHRSRRHAEENAAHIAQLDARLECQKDLLQELEAELAEARSGRADARHAGDEERIRILQRELAAERARSAALARRLAELEAVAHGGAADDLTRIRGVGPRLATQLKGLGIHSLAQIAQLDPEALKRGDHVLSRFRARITRDRWIEQAAALEAG
jgi:predicted flap endonuclease-1-like 5' DNA nuclease